MRHFAVLEIQPCYTGLHHIAPQGIPTPLTCYRLSGYATRPRTKYCLSLARDCDGDHQPIDQPSLVPLRWIVRFCPRATGFRATRVDTIPWPYVHDSVSSTAADPNHRTKVRLEMLYRPGQPTDSTINTWGCEHPNTILLSRAHKPALGPDINLPSLI